MKLKIENERIRIIQNGNVNEKSINIYKIEFEFSSEWDELTKKLIVSKGAQTQEIEIIDNKVIIPNLERGAYALGVVGYIIDDDIIVKRKATNTIKKDISASAAGYEANTETEEEHASVLDEKISELQEIVEKSDIIFEVKEMLDNGELKGEKGDTGDAGRDGVNGLNGTDGKDGYTPIKGIDYWTEEDVSEIKTYVDNLFNSIIDGDEVDY